MKLKPILDDSEVFSGQQWRQLKTALVAQGRLYGIHIEFPDETDMAADLDARWWEAVGKYVEK